MGSCCGKGAKEDAGASPDAGRCKNCDKSGCQNNCDRKSGEKRASGGNEGGG